MTHKEIELLTYIQENLEPSWAEIINAFDPANHATETNALLRKALEDELISVCPHNGRPPWCHVKLSPKGVAALLAKDEQQDKRNQPGTSNQGDNATQKNPLKSPKLPEIIGLLISAAALIIAIIELFN